jgi:hypothetical protein
VTTSLACSRANRSNRGGGSHRGASQDFGSPERFVKGFALVAAEMPELRRIYLRMPWPHLYEYVDSTVCVMHERMIMGDLGLVPLRFHKPDAVPIQELSEMVRDAAATPLEQTSLHRKLVAVARLPLLVRRLIIFVCMNVPRLRRELGTYGVSSAARWRTDLGTSRTPQPCLLSYGPADADGNVIVRLTFDHRVFDGAFAGRALARLEEVLNTSILEELRGLANSESKETGTRHLYVRPVSWQRRPIEPHS